MEVGDLILNVGPPGWADRLVDLSLSPPVEHDLIGRTGVIIKKALAEQVLVMWGSDELTLSWTFEHHCEPLRPVPPIQERGSIAKDQSVLRGGESEGR